MLFRIGDRTDPTELAELFEIPLKRISAEPFLKHVQFASCGNHYVLKLVLTFTAKAHFLITILPKDSAPRRGGAKNKAKNK